MNLDTTLTYDSLRIVEEIIKGNNDEFFVRHNRFIVTYDPSKILEVLLKIKWVIEGKNLLLSDKVKCIIGGSKNDNTVALYRLFLKDYILFCKPNWMYIIPAGREELKPYLQLDELRVFKEAFLYDNYDIDVIEWWDSVSLEIRNIIDKSKLDSGRDGEFFTLQFERKRTGKESIYKAIDSNRLGYDIVSIYDNHSDEKIYIETKCIKTKKGNFYVTRNEWESALSIDDYRFYVWYMFPKKRLIILKKDDLVNHIPLDIGSGRWESISICIDEFEKSNDWVEVEDNE